MDLDINDIESEKSGAIWLINIEYANPKILQIQPIISNKVICISLPSGYFPSRAIYMPPFRSRGMTRQPSF